MHEFEDNDYIINIIVIDIELVSHMIYLSCPKNSLFELMNLIQNENEKNLDHIKN